MSEVSFSVTNARGDITSVTGKGISLAKAPGGRRVRFNTEIPDRTSVEVYLTKKQIAFLVNAFAYTATEDES